MKICFEPDKACLRAEWTFDIRHMSVIEYIDCWNTILKHVQTCKSTYLLIDASDFEYRQLSEANLIFNEITRLLRPENIGIIANKNLLGSKTIRHLLIDCPLQGHHVFDNILEGLGWLYSSKHMVSR